jgi:TusA-related sulfurtransferase
MRLKLSFAKFWRAGALGSLCALPLVASNSAAAQVKKPNIVMLMTDDVDFREELTRDFR